MGWLWYTMAAISWSVPVITYVGFVWFLSGMPGY